MRLRLKIKFYQVNNERYCLSLPQKYLAEHAMTQFKSKSFHSYFISVLSARDMPLTSHRSGFLKRVRFVVIYDVTNGRLGLGLKNKTICLMMKAFRIELLLSYITWVARKFNQIIIGHVVSTMYSKVRLQLNLIIDFNIVNFDHRIIVHFHFIDKRIFHTIQLFCEWEDNDVHDISDVDLIYGCVLDIPHLSQIHSHFTS
ncbi:CLUMA_CG015912, isoform A [Clunio marinus]|uniref:CLUMA_CG015912, isoform A n=1 Tax=Clunio marinus TaxID=568069 RepID=A0A1J1IRC8_9DIPT|nr:CLUMA_CG015912, isoform A [Clunio marinus]